VIHRHEYAAADRQAVIGGQLRFVERGAERLGYAHHFARRSHLGPQDGIELAELVEWEDCFLHSDIRRKHFFSETNVGELLAGHDTRRDRLEWNTDGLRHEWNRATAARVHFQYVHHAVLDGVLDVDQPDDAERRGQRNGMRAHRLLLVLADQVRRDNARGITRVNACILDVLHDSADDNLVPVGYRIDVGLERIFQKLVDQNWAVFRYTHSAFEVI